MNNDQLERIAVALERIADELCGNSEIESLCGSIRNFEASTAVGLCNLATVAAYEANYDVNHLLHQTGIR